MTDSLTMFDVDQSGRCRINDALASVNAARKITGRTERQILAIMEDGRDRTADEIGAALPDIFPATLRGAVSRCADKHLIVATGELRPSNRGCLMTVYRIANVS